MDTIMLMDVSTGIHETEIATAASTVVTMVVTVIKEKDKNVCCIEDKYLD